MTKLARRPLWQFIGALFFLTAACLGSEFVCGHVLHLGPPYNCLVQGDLGDLKAYAKIMPLMHTYGFLPINDHPIYMYPAPVALLYVVFYAFPHREGVMYAVILGTFLIAGVLLGRGMIRRGMPVIETIVFLAATYGMSYPIWYETRAGNMEIFIFILVAVSAWAFTKDRPMLAAVCIGIAAAMKMYPAVFLGVLLARRQYRAVAVAVVTAAALTIYSLAFITPSIAYSYHGIANGIHMYKLLVFEQINFTVIGWDHSLFTLIKRPVLRLPSGPRLIGPILNTYLVTVALGGIALFFLRIQKLPLLNQMILLTTAAIFLPPGSYDYTLMTLYVPWGMLVLFAVQTSEVKVPGLGALLICFAGLLAAMCELIRHFVGFGGQIRALIFVATFVLALRYPLRAGAELEQRQATV